MTESDLKHERREAIVTKLLGFVVILILGAKLLAAMEGDSDIEVLSQGSESFPVVSLISISSWVCLRMHTRWQKFSSLFLVSCISNLSGNAGEVTHRLAAVLIL